MEAGTFLEGLALIFMENFYRNKKVLITGHTGFKGAWLAKILLNWGAEVFGVSLPPHTTPNLFTALSLDKEIKKNYFFDIRNINKVREVMEAAKPDMVFHLAAQAIVRNSYDDPFNTHSTNILGTLNILQAVKETASVKAAVIITTDKVYENKEWLYPYREVDALGGHDPYSASKAAADIVANSYIKSFFNPANFGQGHQTLIAVARAGNVIGGGDWGQDRLIPDMIKAVFERREAVVIRHPQAVRPWQHVLEPLRGYLMLGRELYGGRPEISGAWNFGPEAESFVCVEELVKAGLKVLGRGSYQIVEDAAAKHEAAWLKLDINKASQVLQWRPRWQLGAGLAATFEWYDRFYANDNLINNFTNQQIRLYFNEATPGGEPNVF